MKISSDSLFSLLTPSKTADTTVREERLKSAAEAKLRDAKAAAEALQSRSSQAAEDRKAQARQKIEQLKARLQMLQSMAGVDPKGTARVAAQLARELGQAVKAYAAAGGGAAGMGGVGAPVVPAPGDAVAAEGAEAAAGVGAADQAPAQENGGPKGDEGAKSANPYQQAINEQQAQAADLSRRGNEQRADSDLMAEVRKMAAELKSLVRLATERAKTGEDDALSPQEARDLDKAVAAMDRDLQQATSDMGGGLVSLLI